MAHTSKAVQFDSYGGLDVLEVREVARPAPAAGEVLVAVKAAGINPGEDMIRRGLLHERWPATFPSGQGTDFAGIVEQVGSGVSGVSAGDEVIGWSDERSSQAEFVAVPAEQVVPKPETLDWETAGGLFIVAATAVGATRAVDLKPTDVVVISGAAGGVGTLAVQLAVQSGATVIGLASEGNHTWLREHGAIPVAYGDGVAGRITEAAGGTVDAFIDLFGSGYVDLALELGVAKDRINTIIDFAAVEKYGIKSDGQAAAATAETLTQIATQIAAGDLELPVAATFPLADVQDAYRELTARHTHGKIVLIP